jgi:tetratricopeptide (TPR) repeat protein
MSPDVAENYIARGQFYLRGQEWTLACTDFDRAIVCQPDALKAYLGRSQCLLAQGRLQETLIWLTKSLHRFPEPRPLAEILMKRGRAFYQMGLSAFAVNDFSSALQLLRKLDVRGTAQARFARGLAWIQAGQIEQAKHDLIKLIQRHPEKFPGLPAILTWLSDRSGPPPAGIHQPLKLEKIAKPKIQSGPQKRKYDDRQWEIAPPFDTWIVRDQEREFGPVTKATLNRWFEQGRLTRGMKLTRGDWSRWRAVEKIFRELQEPPAN